MGSIRTCIATKLSLFVDAALKLHTQIARPNGKDDDADAIIVFSSVSHQLCCEFPDVGVIYAGVLGDNEMQDEKVFGHAIAEKLASLGKCALGFQGKEVIDLRGEDFQRIADLVAGQGPTDADMFARLACRGGRSSCFGRLSAACGDRHVDGSVSVRLSSITGLATPHGLWSHALLEPSSHARGARVAL